MITTEKIEEWIKEAEEHPASAQLILKHIATRLRELTQRNEELLNENIALQLGNRVEEYERRIAHLEYQLELLKRQFGGKLPDADNLSMVIGARQASEHVYSIFSYSPHGSVIRVEINPHESGDSELIAQLPVASLAGDDPPRVLATASTEELMFVFSSGRVSTVPVEEIPAVEIGQNGLVSGEQIIVPDKPRGAELLVSLLPVSGLALSDFLVQTSRRGYAKKIGVSMVESILANHYIGTGVRLTTDHTLDVSLCGKDSQLILVSRLGFLSRIDVSQVPHSIEEVMRLDQADHLVSALLADPQRSILIATQTGKLVHRPLESFEIASSLKSRGAALFSKARREQGTRVVGAAMVRENDYGLAIHSQGQVTLHPVQELFARGTIPVHGELLAFSALAVPGSGSIQR